MMIDAREAQVFEGACAQCVEQLPFGITHIDYPASDGVQQVS